MQPLELSLAIASVATVAAALAGVPLGYVQATTSYPGRSLVGAMILLPIVLPPTVLGYLLLYLFGRRGVIGRWLEPIGIELVFSPAGVTIAATLVALPLVAKGAEAAFSGAARRSEEVAWTLGHSRAQTIVRVAIPAARRGLLVAVALGFARALSEFGATLIFAGNVAGRTETLPLAIYNALAVGDDAAARAHVIALVGLAVGTMALVQLLEPRRR